VTGGKNEESRLLEIVDAQGNAAPRMETVRGCSLACANRAGGGCCTMICKAIVDQLAIGRAVVVAVGVCVCV
jgi:hypothetical protein